MSNLLLKHLAQKTMKNKNKKKYKKSKGWFLEERGVMAAVFAEYSVHRPWRIYKKKKKKKEKEKETNQELPGGLDVGPGTVGVVAYTFVGGIAVTFWLLQLSPMQHSMLQSSKVQF